MTVLPPVNTLVRLDVGSTRAPLAVALPSRVDGSGDGELLLAAPGYVGDLDPVGPGTPITVRWAGPRGLNVLPGEIVAVERVGARRWRVRPAGPPEVDQRRRYVRAPVTAQIALVPGVEGPGLLVECELLDLSEGGVRARVGTHRGRSPRPGAPVRVHLALDEGPAVLPATVLRVEPVPAGRDGSPPAHDFVVEFDQPVPVAAAIRRAVLRQQALDRRRGQR